MRRLKAKLSLLSRFFAAFAVQICAARPLSRAALRRLSTRGGYLYIVYIIGIVAAVVVILGVIWLLRSRITEAGGKFSLDKREAEGHIKATPPAKSGPTAALPPPDVDISGNWMIGSNLIRVARNSVRVVRQRMLGQNRIEIKPTPPPAAPQPKARKRKK